MTYVAVHGIDPSTLYPRIVQTCLHHGESVSPGGNPTMEAQVVMAILQPWRRFVFVKGRKTNPVWAMRRFGSETW